MDINIDNKSTKPVLHQLLDVIEKEQRDRNMIPKIIRIPQKDFDNLRSENKNCFMTYRILEGCISIEGVLVYPRND